MPSTAFWGLALLLVISACAKPSTFASIETPLAWPDVEPGLGSGCRTQLFVAVGDIHAKRLEDADQKLSAVLSCFRAFMTDSESIYVSVANAAELDRYRRENGGDREVVWIDWGYREALDRKAFILSAREEFDKALELLRLEAKTAPYAAAPYTEGGYALNGLRKPREALEAYRRGLALAREFESSKAEEPVALRGIGFALIEIGDLDQAESAFRESLEIDPGNEGAVSELGYIEHLRRSQR
jgi:tetratricopeptide (TPR) repeat protein